MKQKVIVGIDVSKRTLDVCIKPSGTTFQITNDLPGFKALSTAIPGGIGHVLVVMEHTGHYSLQLENYLHKEGIGLCKLPALEIKRSCGLTRGKTDKVDAVRIAEYGWLRRSELTAQAKLDPGIEVLKNILSLRSMLVKDRAGHITALKEKLGSGICTANDLIGKVHRRFIKNADVEIAKLDKQIELVISSNENLHKTFKLITTIKGVGMIVAANMIATTANFSKFKNARKFNCYAGIAPFNHESGTSIRGRARVSHLANKQIKSLLNLAAFCAVRCNQELKEYYRKRVSEGKNKMACINIIRAKIVTRMFAVVKRQSEYLELSQAA